MRYRSTLLIAALAPILFLGACAGEADKPKAADKGLVALYVSEGLGDIAPDDAVWRNAPEMSVSLLTQDLTDPKLAETTLPAISVKAVSDKRSVAFRIEWEDATLDTIDEDKRFADAVAIQLPPGPGGTIPDPTMGQADKPVHIHLWKASYEGAAALNDWSLRQTHPNATVDHYPFEAAKGGDSEKLTRQYTIALAAGNQIVRDRRGSVDDLIAHGFGTLTFLPIQASKGWSQWKDGRWAVVISRPLAEPSWPGGEGLMAGQTTFVAFAVWDGGGDQAGSRKMRSIWVPLEMGDNS
jgi:DMSO reductase family type II enzyme heme b subunit